ncbi:hypothetical protein BJX99DRAFT_255639 [Aspergillus californicus]
MDPLALASSIVQFIHFSSGLFNGAIEIYTSATGVTGENRTLETVITELERLFSDIQSECQRTSSRDEEGLRILAAECNTLSTELLGLLEKIKPKNVTSKRQSIWAALKGKYHKNDRQRLESSVERCRSQFEFQVTVLNRFETKESLKGVISDSKDNAVRVEKIQAQLSGLQSGVNISSLSDDVKDQLQDLLNTSHQVKTEDSQKRILNLLSSSDMNERYNIIERAHLQTFEWIFLDQSSEGFKVLDSSLQSAAISFTKWLSSGTGIFHISGKLGSGKSTLMKFLCSHARSRDELQTWAGNPKLVICNFFFWKPGTTLQKSIDGLLRSILYQTLTLCPELISTVFPEIWNIVQSETLRSEELIDIRHEEVREAFNYLLKCRALYSRHCFCYFIDGLDEYQETLQEDHRTITQFLKNWTATAPQGIKICVSSREYNVFLNAFTIEKRLRLQDLTRTDRALCP